MLMMLLKFDMLEDPTAPEPPEGPVELPITELLVLFVLLFDTLGLFDEVYDGWFEC